MARASRTDPQLPARRTSSGVRPTEAEPPSVSRRVSFSRRLVLGRPTARRCCSCRAIRSTAGYDIWTLSLEGDRRPHPFLQTPFNEQYPDLSPDGRWLAYVSNQSGRVEVYVQPYPGPGARQQISVDGGTAPAWSRDGRELFYMTAPSVGGQAALTKMMVVPVQLKPTFTAGTPRMLFEGRYGVTANVRGYDVAPDGRRFLMVQQKDRPATRLADMIIVQNWTEELKQRVPTR